MLPSSKGLVILSWPLPPPSSWGRHGAAAKLSRPHFRDPEWAGHHAGWHKIYVNSASQDWLCHLLAGPRRVNGPSSDRPAAFGFGACSARKGRKPCLLLSFLPGVGASVTPSVKWGHESGLP